MGIPNEMLIRAFIKTSLSKINLKSKFSKTNFKEIRLRRITPRQAWGLTTKHPERPTRSLYPIYPPPFCTQPEAGLAKRDAGGSRHGLKDLSVPLSHGANLHVFVEKRSFFWFLEGPKMYLSPYVARTKNFFSKWPDLLFAPRAFLSNKCIKQMY
jgi:hypothetical protein